MTTPARKCRFAPDGQRLTPYQKIVRAGRRRTGVTLTVADVDAMMLDTAILFRAQLDDDNHLNEFDEPMPDRRRS